MTKEAGAEVDSALALAIAYGKAGVPAFPVAVSWNETKGATDKRPLTERGHLNAATDVEAIVTLFAFATPLRAGEVLGVGLHPGPAGVVVLDVDTTGDYTGDETLRALERAHGALPATLRVRSASGGFHLWLDKGTLRVTGRHDLGAGIDVKADDGWTIAPGTRTPWGSWSWEGCSFFDTAPAAAPAWLLAKLNVSTNGAGATGWSKLDRDKLDALTLDALVLLERLGGHDAYMAGTEVRVTRPGKRNGTSATIGHVGPGVVRCFTSSWPPLRDGVVYDLDTLAAIVAGESEGTSALTLPATFWERPVLAYLRKYAHARTVSPDVLLHVACARVCAMSSHRLALPATIGSRVSLCFYSAALGPSGTGKSGANGVGLDLFPPPPELPLIDQVPPGSGEGLIELLFATVEEKGDDGKPKRERRQVAHNCYAYVDEGQSLLSAGGRAGSTTWATLRSLWTGGPSGFANASQDRKRILARGTYVFGLVIGFQDHLAGALLDDVDAGTPQRFVWSYAVDPTLPEEPPAEPPLREWLPPTAALMAPLKRGTLDPHYVIPVPAAVVAEVRAAGHARRTGAAHVAPLDSHRMLVRLKCAAALMLLDGRVSMDEEDWRLAGVMLTTSDAVREHAARIARTAAGVAEAERNRKAAARAEAEDKAVRHGRLADGARKLARKVWSTSEPWAWHDLYRTMRRYREDFDEVVAEATRSGWVEVEDAAGDGHAGHGGKLVKRGARRAT